MPCLFVPLMEAPDVRSVVDMLKYRSRSLSVPQMELIVERSQQESSALYLSLAVSVVCKWSSFMDNADVVLSSGVSNLIKQIFSVAEKFFGRVIIRAALGFITISLAGLSDTELLDLMSLHKDVMDEVNQYAIANSYALTERLPSHVWLRIRYAFAGLLVEREEGRLFWYHRQLHETAMEVYGPAVDRSISEVLGRYFGGLIPPHVRELRSIAHQPLVFAADNDMVWFPNSVVNKRRCVEAARHLRNAGLMQEAIEELCSIEAISARAKSGDLFNRIT